MEVVHVHNVKYVYRLRYCIDTYKAISLSAFLDF